MLRAVSAIYVESQALEMLTSARKDVYKLFRSHRHISSASGAGAQTVLASDGSRSEAAQRLSASVPSSPLPPPPPPPPPPQPPRRAWTITAAAVAVTASLGGVYFYRKLSDEESPTPSPASPARAPPAAEEPVVEPKLGSMLPSHVHFLLVGAGTASFAAMRAIRSARPEALVLMVGAEPHPPYMRPPLSKELWREPELASAPPDRLHALSFRQWNGKRRPLAYEPLAFYTPAEALADSGGGAALARGWRVTRLDVERREAELSAPGRPSVTLAYDECLLATGSRPRRLEALQGARAAGRVRALRGARDAVRLARALEEPGARRVVLVGGGFLASELSAALAERLSGTGVRVTQLFREEAPLARVLPPYLAAEAARRLEEAGVELRPGAEVVGSTADALGARLALADGSSLRAACVVECAGAEPELELARGAGLEEHAALGGLLVTAELQARAHLWAAGDVACFYDVALGRRRVEHHDHAVVSGRLAGENMAGVQPARPYRHQSMFWSDLGPDLGYEAIGIIDSRLPTVGVFSASAVTDVKTEVAAAAGSGAGEGEQAQGQEYAQGQESAQEPEPEPASEPGPPEAGAGAGAGAGARRYERGVVFYTREKRVVGVLLWNLFNRMHIARQVLAQGEFEDLFEVAKLFALHEDD